MLNFALSSGVGVGARGIGVLQGCRLNKRVETLVQSGCLVGRVAEWNQNMFHEQKNFPNPSISEIVLRAHKHWEVLGDNVADRSR